MFDQRGTGGSGVLRCPPLQALGTLDVVNTRIVERCALGLGPARQFYSTTDSVLDLDAVREALGAPRLELMGISYGTYVAAQYARRFPDRTEGLILDSVVGPDGIDAYFLDTFERLRRVLAEQCAGRRCRGATEGPQRRSRAAHARCCAPRAARRDPRASTARRAATAVHDESELLLMIMSGDLNPFLQAALPGRDQRGGRRRRRAAAAPAPRRAGPAIAGRRSSARR